MSPKRSAPLGTSNRRAWKTSFAPSWPSCLPDSERMAAKRFLFGQAGRRRLLSGVRLLEGAVRPTLGPGGRNVLLQRPGFSAPLATKDGVTVAEEVELRDAFANMGVQLVIE